MTITPEKLDEIERVLEPVLECGADWWSGDDDMDMSGALLKFDRAYVAVLDPDTVRELVRLARIGRDIEQGREQYVRGFRVHVPIGEPGDF